MTRLDSAIRDVNELLTTPRAHPARARVVRARIARLHAALLSEPSSGEGWQTARKDHLVRERGRLAARLHALASRAELGSELFSAELKRFVLDLQRHRQRVNDLVYDSASMDLGGSE